MEIRMNYQEFKNAVLAAAKENNLKDYELYYTESSGTSVEAYQSEINKIGRASCRERV